MSNKNLLFPHTQDEQVATSRLAEIEEAILKQQDTIDNSFIEIGRLLLEAKSYLCKHGEWILWLEKNVDMPVCKAQRLMRIAKRFSEKAPELYWGYTKLYILAAIPEERYDEFISSKHDVNGEMKSVHELSKNELQKVVRAWLGKSNKNAPKNETSSTSARDPIAVRLDSLKACADELFSVIDSEDGCLDTSLPELSDLRNVCKYILARLSEAGLEE